MRAGAALLPRGPWFVLLLLCASVGCSDSDSHNTEEPPLGTEREIRLTSNYNSVLSIGKDPILEYPYDARGPGSPGTMTYTGHGRANLFFAAEDMSVKNLYPFGEGVPAYVEILPADMRGAVDFCTGQVFLAYEAQFVPVVFGIRQGALSVVTELTTGTSSGDFRVVTGRPMDERGDCRLVSVAVVPRTGDPFVDRALGLPTDAVSEIESHFDFPQGRFPCPGEPPQGVADEVHMVVGKDGRLSISFLGSIAEFPYDGKGSDGVGALQSVAGGIATVEFSQFAIPPLRFFPWSDRIRIEIEPHQLIGRMDFCTGRLDLDFDATFTPVMDENEMTSISVVTTITTETSSGYSRTVTGERLDRWGDALLVGVAKVPETGDPMIDWMLGLPNDAVCELPVHLDFTGGSRPTCPEEH